MNPRNDVLFSSDLWKPALEKYAGVTHTTVKLFDPKLRTVFGPIHPTPLFEMFDKMGFDPGIFAECANRCLAQTEKRPAVVVNQVHGLAVVGTSLVLEGKVVGAAVAGYELVDFSQVSEIRSMAHKAGIGFEQLWQVAREQKPIPQSRLLINGELLQVLGDALLRENSRTRQYEETVVTLQETARANEEVHRAVEKLNINLREREERYRALFELGPVAVYSCDAAGVIDNFNHRAAELWGRAPAPGDTDERFCGSYKLFRPDGRFLPHEQCPMADVVSGKITEVRDQEVLIERPDGSRITVIVNIRPLTDARSEIIGAINCFYDISDRKRAEEALRVSEQRLTRELAATQQLQSASALLIQGSNGGAHILYQKIVDAAAVIMRSDMASMQMLSSERGHEGDLQLLGQSGFSPETAAFWKWVRPGSGTTCGQALRRAERVIAADVEECDFMAGTADLKQYREAGIRAVQSTPLLSRGGRLLGMISTHWRTAYNPPKGDLSLFDILARQAADVLERIEGEEALRLAAEFDEAVMTNMGEGLYTVDSEGRVTFMNAAAERLFGWKLEEIRGRKMHEVIHHHHADGRPFPAEECEGLQVLMQGKPLTDHEDVFIRKDGTFFDVTFSSAPLRSAHDEISGLVVVLRDTTVRKQAEALLKQSHEELEHKVEERTADLRKLSSNLLHAQDDERRRISRELHDSLGQYLAAAKMNLQSLKKPEATPKEAQRIDELMETLDKCSVETRTISYLLHPPLLDEVGFASAAKWYVQGFSKRSGIEVHLNLPEGLKRLPGTLELVFFRILQKSLTNIHRHSQTESVDIKLELAGDAVTLQVRDYGKGIPAELLQHFRAGTSVGVGLRSMRERIGELGGRLEIQSDSSGTLIKVTAPRSEAATKAELAIRNASA